MNNNARKKRVADRLESLLACELNAYLRGLPVGAQFAVSPSADLCDSLELFVPRLLRSRYSEWIKEESLDGIFVASALKTGPTSAQLIGTCILISDQTVTPFFLDLQLSDKGDTVAAVRVMLGEQGKGRLGISGPPCNSPEAMCLLSTLTSRLDEVEWVYTFASDEQSMDYESAFNCLMQHSPLAYYPASPPPTPQVLLWSLDRKNIAVTDICAVYDDIIECLEAVNMHINGLPASARNRQSNTLDAGIVSLIHTIVHGAWQEYWSWCQEPTDNTESRTALACAAWGMSCAWDAILAGDFDSLRERIAGEAVARSLPAWFIP